MSDCSESSPSAASSSCRVSHRCSTFTAAIVQLPDGLVQSALAVIWALAGLATALLLYRTMARLGTRPWLGVVVVSLFLIAPETILTESWYFYTELQILVTTVALFTLTRFAADRRTRDGLFFASSLGVLVLLRSSFHIVLMVLVLVVVWHQLSLYRRQDHHHRGGAPRRRRRVRRSRTSSCSTAGPTARGSV